MIPATTGVRTGSVPYSAPMAAFRRAALLALAVLALLVAIPSASAAPVSVNLGAALSLTGNASAYGLSSRRGIDLAAAEINAGAVSGVRMRVKTVDDLSTTPGAAADARRKIIRRLHQRRARQDASGEHFPGAARFGTGVQPGRPAWLRLRTAVEGAGNDELRGTDAGLLRPQRGDRAAAHRHAASGARERQSRLAMAAIKHDAVQYNPVGYVL